MLSRGRAGGPLGGLAAGGGGGAAGGSLVAGGAPAGLLPVPGAAGDAPLPQASAAASATSGQTRPSCRQLVILSLRCCGGGAAGVRRVGRRDRWAMMWRAEGKGTPLHP